MTNPENKRILILDATILNSIQQCPWLTYISFVKNLRLNKPQEHFERGDLAHCILERYYTCLLNKISIDEAREDAIEKGREKYVTLNLDIDESEWIIQSFILYTKRWETDGIEVIEVEKPFMILIYEDDELMVYYSGKIDLKAKFPLIGETVMDHKSRYRKNDEIILNNQFIGYAIASQTDVVYVNEFGLQKTLKPEEKFRRMPLSYTTDLKKHWVRNTIQWAKRLDWHMQENNWPEIWNPFKCNMCAVKPVCETGSMMEKERKLMTQFYQEEPWDVTKGLE